MTNQTYTMGITLFQKLFPETKLPKTATNSDIQFEDAAIIKQGANKLFDFTTRDSKTKTNQINFPDLTTLEKSPYPNKYYWNGNSFQYNLIGTTPNGKNGGHDFLISCDFDIDPNCFYIQKSASDPNASDLIVERVEIFDVTGGAYRIHIKTPEDSIEVLSLETFKDRVMIKKVRVPFKNTFYCSGLSLYTTLLKNERLITYSPNPYNEMAFADRGIIPKTASETDIVQDGQKYYIPDKYRLNEINENLYFSPTSASAGYLELR